MNSKLDRRRNWLIICVALATIGVDQVSKVIARKYLVGDPVRSYLWDTFRVQHAQNPGAFLSLGSGLEEGARFGIFTLAVGAFLLYATWSLFKNKSNEASTVAMSLFIAGGIGNLIDRILFASVTDFLNVGLGPVRTGIFNIADMAIIGGLVILIAVAFKERQRENQARHSDSP